MDEKLRKKIMRDEKSFIEYHKTGYIRPNAYEDAVRDMAWLKKKEHPLVCRKVRLKGNEEVELCKSGEKLKYVKHDLKGEIVRDKKGDALYLSIAEMKKKKLPLHDTSVVAFNKKGEAVGYSSNEWGADGIWVAKPYQRRGLGYELLKEFRTSFRPERQMGQMTPAGEMLARKYYRKLKKED